MNQNIIFKKIDSTYPLLESVIKYSIGLPTKENITQILQNYCRPDHFLIGAFSPVKLIAVIGFKLTKYHAEVKHISVIEQFRRQGIGKSLINEIIKQHFLYDISLETDAESLGFYEKIGFKCEPFENRYGTRYRCKILGLSNSTCGYNRGK